MQPKYILSEVENYLRFSENYFWLRQRFILNPFSIQSQHNYRPKSHPPFQSTVRKTQSISAIASGMYLFSCPFAEYLKNRLYLQA